MKHIQSLGWGKCTFASLKYSLYFKCLIVYTCYKNESNIHFFNKIWTTYT
jgi:hypothetical protein